MASFDSGPMHLICGEKKPGTAAFDTALGFLAAYGIANFPFIANCISCKVVSAQSLIAVGHF